jgi:hypothetical protein
VADDILYRKIMPPFLGPWFKCVKCGYATSALLQEPGWEWQTDKVKEIPCPPISEASLSLPP